SQREKENVVQVWEEIQTRNEGVTFHKRWYVIDSLLPNAYSIGTTLYLTSGSIRTSDGNPDEFLGALIAHEIGHLENGDSSTLKALRNFVLPFIQHLLSERPRKITRGTVSTEGGQDVDDNQKLFYAIAARLLVM